MLLSKRGNSQLFAGSILQPTPETYNRFENISEDETYNAYDHIMLLLEGDHAAAGR